MRIGKNDHKTGKNSRNPSNRPGAPTKLKKGAPAKYNPAFDNVAFEACANLGADISNLARMFGCSIPTIYNWMREHPSFNVSINTGRDESKGRKVEDALMRCITGYDHTVIEEKVTPQGNVVQCKREIHVAADYKAAAFWLCNRMKDRWQAVVGRMQQLNAFLGTNRPEDNAIAVNKGEGKPDATIETGVLADADGVRAVIDALRQAGAFDDVRLALPGPEADTGADTKTN